MKMIKQLALVGCLGVVFAGQATAGDWAVEGYGGVRLQDNLQYNDNGAPDFFDTETGHMLGAAFLYGITDNLEVGVDINASSAEYTGYGTEINSKAIMAVARYTHNVTGAFGVYGGIGLGWIETEYDGKTIFPSVTGKDTNFGGQVSFGVQFEAIENISLFTEFRHQRTFSDSTIAGIDPIEYQSNNILAGIRFEF